VGPMLAEFLDVLMHQRQGHGIHRRRICLVEANLDNGCMKMEMKLPALITVNKAVNEPRIPDVME